MHGYHSEAFMSFHQPSSVLCVQESNCSKQALLAWIDISLGYAFRISPRFSKKRAIAAPVRVSTDYPFSVPSDCTRL